MREKLDPTHLDHRLAALAAGQHGRVARRQLLALGIGSAAIGRRVANGRLHPVHRGVYAVGHVVRSPAGDWMAAVLACGPLAVLSHRSAAALWDMRPRSPFVPDVCVPTRAGRGQPGIAVHRSGTLDARDVTTHRGIPVTSPARTLIDLAEVVPRRVLERAKDEAEAELRLDWRTVRDAIARPPAGSGQRACGRCSTATTSARP